MNRNSAGEKGKANVYRNLAILCVSAAVLLCVAAWGMLHFLQDDQGTAGTQARVETGALLSRTAGAGIVEEESRGLVDGCRTFVNQPAPSYEGDKRKVFKVVEVVPNDACSTFPYMVEWGTEEEYDRNVPVGYEGLMWMSAYFGSSHLFTEKDVAAQSAKPFTRLPAYIRKDYLSFYGDNIGVKEEGLWYREADMSSEGMVTQNGYFEYVGEKKGTYYVAVSYIVEGSVKKGIHYAIQAMPRKGDEAPKGEMYVDKPAYYIAKDSASLAKPLYNGKEVVSRTGFNYDFAFSQSAAGAYRVDTNHLHVRPEAEPEPGAEGVPTSPYSYDYFLKIRDGKEAGWKTGFSYRKGGNYQVKSASITPEGRYVRVSNSQQADNYQNTAENIEKGYFRLYNPLEDAGATRYDVLFEGADRGYYCANAPLNWEDKNYLFVYKGEDKGVYDVVFIYNSAGTNVTTYEGKLLEVSNGEGRYALTSTVKDEEGEPVYKEGEGHGDLDYSKVVTNIDYVDAASWGQDSEPQPGVCLGAANGNGLSAEHGGWVFHEVESEEDMQPTKVKDIYRNCANVNSNLDSNFKIGDRIYVHNQERRRRFYCRDGFANNEWFKLLFYFDNPKDSSKPYSEMVDGVGYDGGKTAMENLSMAREQLTTFDANNRIEIVQKTPDELTTEDVRNADLLYISDEEGVEGLLDNWEKISDFRVKAGKPPLRELSDVVDKDQGQYEFKEDLSADVLFAIYDACIYKQEVALMTSPNLSRYDKSSNLYKVFFLMNWFDDAQNFAYFMPMYEEFNEAFTTIAFDGEKAYAYVYADENGIYNRGHRDGDSNNDDYTSEWEGKYFMVFLEGATSSDYGNIDHNFDFKDDMGSRNSKVQDGESKYLIDWYAVNAFQFSTSRNIWTILHNRNRSKLVVEITNAHLTAGANPQRVIYADEFDPGSFDVSYEIKLDPPKGGGAALNDTIVYFDDNNDGVYDAGSETSYRLGGQSYDTEYTQNVRSGFAEGGSADPAALLDQSVVKRKIVVEASDVEGRTAYADVWIVVREPFDLN